ncbi:hypothetical protein [Alishewanella longhuensis]
MSNTSKVCPTTVPAAVYLADWFERQPAPLYLGTLAYSELQHQLRENGASFERWHTPSRQLDLLSFG